MRDFFYLYPYFGTSLLVVVLCIVGMLVFPRQRKATLLSSLVAIPWGVWSLFLVPEYWTPRNLVQLGRAGIEDFLWAFGTGGITWMAAAVPIGRRIKFHEDLIQVGKRFLLTTAIGFAVFGPLFLSGVQGMVAFAISVIVLGTYLLIRRPENWSLAVTGGVGFGIINFLVTEMAVVFCPEYFQQMNPNGLSGRFVINLPIEEVYWAFATGATWPLLVCYLFEDRGERNRGKP